VDVQFNLGKYIKKSATDQIVRKTQSALRGETQGRDQNNESNFHATIKNFPMELPTSSGQFKIPCLHVFC